MSKLVTTNGGGGNDRERMCEDDDVGKEKGELKSGLFFLQKQVFWDPRKLAETKYDIHMI